MSMNDQIREFIQRELVIDAGAPLHDDTRLLEESLIDSMGIFKLASFLEEQFGIEVHDREMIPDHFGSVQSLVSFVESKRRGAKGTTA